MQDSWDTENTASFIGWVPTPPEHIEGFFELVEPTPSDVVFDLGSGDGRLLFKALEKGAGRVVGVDLDPQMVNTAREAARGKGVEAKASFIEGDVRSADLSYATVVFCYLCTEASITLKPKFEKELRPGTKVVMETFSVPGWKPVKTVQRGWKDFYLYVMPPERDGG